MPKCKPTQRLVPFPIFCDCSFVNILPSRFSLMTLTMRKHIYNSATRAMEVESLDNIGNSVSIFFSQRQTIYTIFFDSVKQ